MDPQDVLGTRLRAWYWPPSVPLRRLATINGALWAVVSLVGLAQPSGSTIADLIYGFLFASVSWAALRLFFTDNGGRLAPRLHLRWMHAKGGRPLFTIQGLITLYIAQHDLVAWTAQPTLSVAGTELAAGVFLLGCTWGVPAVAVATVSHARLLGAGQTGGGNQPPPYGQQGQQQSNSYESWDYTQQDIPQDEAWSQPPPGAHPPPPIHDAVWACGVLHVHPNATLGQIERVYKNLSATWHPDTAQTPKERAEKEAHMKELNEAIDLLRKREKDAP